MQSCLSFLVSRYGIAVFTTGIALALTFQLSLVERASWILFLTAVMVSAWHGGLGPGLLATLLSALVVDFFFLPPVNSFDVGLTDAASLGVFGLAAILISALNAGRKRAERFWRQQAQSKDEFVAALGHELRTSLSAMFNALHLLRLRDMDTAAVEQTQNILDRQVHKMARLVDDLLDLSRVGYGKLLLCKKCVNLNEIVRHALDTTRSLMETRGHHLDVSLPDSSVLLTADPTRLEQILVNLLTNAAKYTEPGGRIWLTVERGQGEVLLRVRDTGIGLLPKVLPTVFGLFVQAKNGSQGGLGIGLHLVQSLVRLHGGTITVSSPGPGLGSEFVVRLPLLLERKAEGRPPIGQSPSLPRMAR